MPEINIKILEIEGDKNLFEQWYQSIKDKVTKRRILVQIKRLELGNFADWKSLGEGIYEIRLTFGPGYRIYFARQGDKIVIILAGGEKSTQDKDIKEVKALWRKYKHEIERFSRNF